MTGKAAILGIKNDQIAGLQTPTQKIPKAFFVSQQSNYTHHIKNNVNTLQVLSPSGIALLRNGLTVRFRGLWVNYTLVCFQIKNYFLC